jgi:hypothetical protein
VSAAPNTRRLGYRGGHALRFGVPFVPDDFDVPRKLDLGWCRLRPLTTADNAEDFAAWHGSIDHIRATPGFAERPWPVEDYSLERNDADLQEHEADFADRKGFTYTVLDPDGKVIGCLYIYPASGTDSPEADATVRSWVCADHADRDVDLYRAVMAWLADAWPFINVAYATRLPTTG